MNALEAPRGAVGPNDFARQVEHAQNRHTGETARARKHSLDVIAQPVRNDDDPPLREGVSPAEAAHARGEGCIPDGGKERRSEF